MSAERDAQLPQRLLESERDALLPLLRAAPEADFALRTACPDWNVRQVLAHCSAVLTRVVEDRVRPGGSTPESNAADVAERDDWPLERVLDELEYGMTEAGPVLAGRADGKLDGIALGEWVHAGDVRDAWGLPEAYQDRSGGAALAMLAAVLRDRPDIPLVRVRLTGRVPDGVPQPLPLGTAREDRAPATLVCDVPTLIRLCTGRPLDGAPYALSGARESELNLYG